MATKRKPRPPRGYRDGGRVLADDALPGFGREEPVTADEPAPAPPPPPPVAAADDPVRRALDATERAERMRREPTPEMIIDAMPVSEKKKAFLRENQALAFDDFGRQAAAFFYASGLRRGIADDSDEMFDHIRRGVAGEMGVRRERDIEAAHAAIEHVPEMPPPPTVEHAAEQLGRDAAAHRMTEAADPMEIAADLAPAPAPRRRNIPMTAPVSRDVPMMSGQKVNPRSITLTAEEREIARNSFGSQKGAADMTDEQKELLYLQNKLRLQRMRADGTYHHTTEQSG